MRIGLFVPCYIDAFFPKVGIATLELLERLGHDVVYPPDQTCCGQPMANSGFNAECADTEALFVRNFAGFDYIVAPSGSCVHRVRDNFDAIEQTAAARHPGVTGHRGRRSLGVVLSDITLTSRLSRATGQFPAALEPACCKRIEKADRRPPRYWATQKIEPGSRNRPVPRRGGDRRRHTYPTSR